MSLGWRNPLPIRLGPRSRTEQIYAALRSAQGVGISGQPAAGPQDGLRDLWIKCVARAIARRGGTTVRAVLQFFPATMTSSLASWEQVLNIPQAPTDSERRAAISAALTQQIDASIPGLRASLSAIDPNLDVLVVPWAQARTTEPGKLVGPLPGVALPAYFGTVGPLALAGRVATGWPMFSDGHLVLVTFTSTFSEPLPPQKVAQAVRTLMGNTLPSYVGWSLGTISPGAGGSGPSGAGFFCDGAHGSRLDFTRIF